MPAGNLALSTPARYQSRMKGNRLIWLAPLLVGLSGIAGYSAGAAGRADSRPPDRLPPVTANERKVERPRNERGDPIRDFHDLLDPASRETDVWKIVSRLPEDRLAEVMRDVREKLAVTPSRGSEAERLAEIQSALYFRWAEFDPEAALADVSAIPKSLDFRIEQRRTTLLKSVLAAWMRSDADAAYVAVKDHKDFGYVGRNMLVQTWTAENVFENLERHPDKRRNLLGWYCAAAAENVAQRDAMLAALESQPDMKDGDWAKFMLFRSWGYDDFTAAVEAAKALGYQDRVEQIVDDNLQSKPHLALPFATENGIDPGGQDWENGYRFWRENMPDEARRWLAKEAPKWRDAGHHDALLGLLAQDYSLSVKSEIPPAVTSSARDLIDALTEWRREDPEAAGNWLDTAPEAARELLLSTPRADHE